MLGLGFGDFGDLGEVDLGEVDVVSGRGASASPNFVATICAFCREINCLCDIVRADSVCVKCVVVVELYTQPQCM